MNCIITRLPTKNKWRNKPIHPVALKKAKLMMGSQVDQVNVFREKMTLHTMRDCLIYLQEEFRQILATEKEVSNEKYAELLKNFLGGEE